MMRSGLMPSASAVKLVTMRCRSTAGATACTSSIPGASRPRSAARVFAPSTRYCEARGPAPHESHWRMNSGEPFGLVSPADAGRVARASRTA